MLPLRRKPLTRSIALQRNWFPRARRNSFLVELVRCACISEGPGSRGGGGSLQLGDVYHAHRPDCAADRSRSAQALRRNRARRSLAHRGTGRARPRRDAVRKRGFHDVGQARSRCGRGRCGSTARCAIRTRCTWRCWSRCGGGRTSSTSCISISTIIRSRCSRASRRRSSRRCTAGSICPSISRCSTRSRPCRWSRSRTRSGGRCRRRDWVGTVHHGLPEKLLTPHAGQAVLSRVPRPHLAGEARRSRDPHRRACGIPLKIAAKVDRGRPRLLRGRDPSAARAAARRVHRRDQRSARSRNSSAARSRCWCRSIGPSRSAW